MMALLPVFPSKLPAPVDSVPQLVIYIRGEKMPGKGGERGVTAECEWRRRRRRRRRKGSSSSGSSSSDSPRSE
jgi:hypothetical protein